MAGSRLTKNQKKDLVEGFRAGKSSGVLAEEYACSINTVNRTVKNLLTTDEYNSLKATRSKSIKSKPLLDAFFNEQEKSFDLNGNNCDDNDALDVSQSEFLPIPVESFSIISSEEAISLENADSSTLALDDAEDFLEEAEEENFDLEESSEKVSDVFQEIIPLPTSFPLNERQKVSSKPLSSGLLPETVFMLVEKNVELDIRLLSDFPELGPISEEEQKLKALSLFSNQRSAKRSCARSQRVIKIPNTSIFNLSKTFLLARGISCLVIDGDLIALDK